ncbi:MULTISPECIES: carbohydrate ABC transporter permease [unclassified Curtobacterium]|uniref:carbohydrate ABC transporter permease n=1 Tax=unclassified Curtobacterium TaxID=257496 RepID=UPI000DA9B6AD|nr:MULTISPECIES: sugar ABC transporter permease [unclassified Curtobacterium]PZE25368.1 sugar ABC transporter permease [Curtobacterium sp. MCBD17_028]PZF58005.1 sugar ABC transporter permease [Curtobacterium sp. MCBD17_034]PZM33196.1 sugar ABC transporter permease [Curtobacterium sp. MCBD17_031]WIB62893.1 sugar ABC transporter permease [Curtobacterium sp. MCBD17_040]WIB66733.1 sugar ABC transporter permease [Curtobacterium sp. MCBD17_035]
MSAIKSSIRAARRPTSSRRRAWLRTDNPAAWLMLAPAVVLLLWWFAYPIAQSVVLSVQQVGKFDFDQRSFVGLQNFGQLFADPAFGRSLGITATFVAGVVPAQTVLAIVVAAVLRGATVGKGALRTAYFVPYMTSTVAITTIFMQLFVKGGIASTALSLFGLPNATWYASPGLALWFLVIVYVYMFVGLYIVIFVGGMETIPADLYEAAEMDGAGAFRQFLSVTLPGVRPFTAFVVLTGIIQAIQVFDQAYVISGGTVLGSPAGATSTIVIFIYQQAFRLSNIGYASAATVILLAIVILAGVVSRLLGPKEQDA